MKTTEEKNRMIAEFMGIKVHELDVPHILEDTKYHTSWDWLMPVVEKIEWGLGNGENFWIKVSKIDGEHSYIPYVYYSGHDNGKPFDITLHNYFESKLDATYQAVIQFIEWYNKQK